MNPTSKVSTSSTADIAATEVEEVEACSRFSLLHPDIIQSHILTRLDGPSLATASSSSTTLHQLSSGRRRHQLWSHLCHSTWPSTALSPRLSGIISTFPDGGPHAFFALSFPLPQLNPPVTCSSSTSSSSSSSPPSELISAVDIHYKNELVFSKVQETETVTGWFRCSPFRIELLEPKDVIPTSIRHPEGDDACSTLMEDMSLSWILIDPTGQRAVNLSSQMPVSVQRHWLSGEVQVTFASILAPADQKKGARPVQCGIVVTGGKSEGGEMQVREVCMEMEDMDGMHLNGRDSLVILDRCLEGKRGKALNREEEGRRRYKEYVEMKQERKERKLRTERALDIFCVAFGVSIFVAFWCFVWCR